MKTKMKNKLNLFRVEDNQLKNAKAGVANTGNPGDGSCGCSCYYADLGGSSTKDNRIANSRCALWSPIGEQIEYTPPPVVSIAGQTMTIPDSFHL